MPAPVISVAQMREWEKATWAAGRTEEEVIRRVGHIVADRASQMTRPGDLIVVLAGKGHNGDDARHASQNLAGREVRLINVAEPDFARKEFLAQLSLQPALIIDGLFGIGLNRKLDSKWVKLVDAINAARVPTLAVDVPSGLNADTGEVHGAAIRAAVTLTLGAPKRGLLTSTAWPHLGRLEVAPDIGLVPCLERSEVQWTLREDFFNFPPERPAEGHKGTFGHVAIIAGSLGYHGAAVLCGRGALRAQPGLVSIVTAENVLVPVASQLQAAMVHPWRRGGFLPEKCSTIVAGPGLAATDLPDELPSTLERLWKESALPMLVDASALPWVPSGPARPNVVRIITPHPGEAAQMLQSSIDEIQTNRPKTVRDLSRRFGDCWVVLKGYQTCIGRSTGEVFVNPSGNPFLAQGGSGDVLSGYLGGLLAQPSLQRDPLKILRYGVWQHGAAADSLRSRRSNWGLSELLDEIGNAV